VKISATEASSLTASFLAKEEGSSAIVGTDHEGSPMRIAIEREPGPRGPLKTNCPQHPLFSLLLIKSIAGSK
jgi:hypothetical protein